MAEELGDAILRLRTDDSAFTAGVDKAEVQASGLGKTLDLTSGSAVGLADKLDQAAKSGDRGAQAFLKASAAIEQLAQAQTTSKNEIDNAKAALDAGAISMDRYNKEVLESKAQLALFEDEHRRAQTELRNYLRTSDQVTTASGAQKAGLQQLTQQLGDMSVMYSMGARPAQIFSSQIGQTTSAIQLMAGEGSKFAAFIANPWVQGIMIGTAILGPLIASLDLTEEKLIGVRKAAADAMAELRGSMAGTSKFADAIDKNAKSRVEAMGDLARVNREIAQTEALLYSLSRTPGGAEAAEGLNSRLLSLERQKTAAETQLREAQKNLDEIGGLANAAALQAKAKAAQDKRPDSSSSSSSSDSKSTDSGDRASRARASEIARLEMEELRARLAIATTAEERSDISYDLLAAEKQQRIDEIASQKDLTEKERQARLDYIERLYGSRTIDENGNLLVTPSLYGTATGRRLEQEQAQLENDMLAREAASLDAWAQLAMTTDERLALERQALALQEQIQRNLLEQQIANGQIADADKARAELASQQAAAREGLERQGAGPLEVYVNGLRADRAETGRLVEGLIVDELDYVHRSITDSIADRLGVKDPFLRGLIAMFVQQQLIQPMAEALQSMMNGMGGGGGGFFGTVLGGLGSLFGGGNGGFLSGLVSSANSWIDGGGQLNLSGASGLTVNAADNAAFAGFFAEGGTIGPGEWGFAGENGIEPVFGGTTGVSVMSNPDARRMFGAPQNNRPDTLHVTVSGARGNAEIQEMVQSGVSQGLAAYDSVVGDRVQEHLARFG